MAQFGAADDDFDLLNSSDQEYEVAPKPHFRAGWKSIEAMHEARNEDRLASKKRLRELDDVRGAPGTITIRHLWMNRIEAHAKSFNIVIDPIRGPTADMLIRFLDTIVKHIEVRYEDKPAPTYKYLRSALQKLEKGLDFKYPQFKLSRHECARLDALFDTLAKEKKLFRGRWRERQWLGANILEKISRSWLMFGLNTGCSSWDVHLQKLLSVVMLAALGCRSGELALSGEYDEEYMSWKHITLTLDLGDKDTLDSVRASVLLCFEKHKKRELGENRSVPLKTLQHPSLNFICPIKLLLVQALRSGNVGPSLEEVLLQTSRRVDRTIQWNFPDRPVFPAMMKPAYTFLDWQTPAPVSQLRKTTIQIAAVGGVLANVTAHDWRRGFARDIRYAQKVTNSGAADAGVARAMGHSLQAMNTGVTDAYVGDVEHETYTARAEERFVGRTQPAVGDSYQKIRLTTQEVDDYCRVNNIDPKSRNGRHNAAEHLRKQKRLGWQTTQKNATIPPVSVPTRPPLSTWTASETNLAKKRKSELPIAAQPEKMPAQAALPDDSSQVLSASDDALSADFLSVLDPELVLMTMNTIDEDDPAFKRLEDFLSDDPPEPTEEEQDDALDMMLENMELSEGTEHSLTMEPHKFVDFFSKINIVRNSAVKTGARLDERLALKIATGNTRDSPTLYIFTCPRCNIYKTTDKYIMEVHDLTCKPGEKKPKPFKCSREGCENSYETEAGLKWHVDSTHDYAARKCATPSCSEKVFTTHRAWQFHLDSRHNPLDEPTTCKAPACKSDAVWKTVNSYMAHLRVTHKLLTAASRKPYLNQKKASHWPAGQCPIGGKKGCTSTYQSRANILRHLTAKEHKLSKEDAGAVADEIASTIYVLVNIDSVGDGENDCGKDGDEDGEEADEDNGEEGMNED